jgi:hypothetical protein
MSTRGERGLARDQSGNILVLFAILLPLFMFTGMIAVDVGYWWVNARKAQIAADACALAAARDLPAPSAGWDKPDCVHGGRDYVLTNLPAQGTDSEPQHVSTRVVSPFETNPTQVEATVRLRVRTFFGRFIGLGGVDLSRRAVAEQSSGEGDYAIYARASDCSDALRFNGEDMNIDGRVHSNGEFTVDGEDFWAAVGTHDGPASPADGSCSPSTDPDTLFGSPKATATESEPDDVGFQPWPEWFTPDQFGWTSGCTFSGQKIEIDDTTLKITGRPDMNHGGTLPSGTYCATELFKIGGNGLTGVITALAPKIEVGGDDHDFTSFASNKVLFFAVPNTDLVATNDGSQPDGAGVVCTHSTEMNLVNGNNGVWKGRVFSPCGRVIVNGNASSTIEGAIYAKLVRINGGGFNMIGKGASGADKVTALVQ